MKSFSKLSVLITMVLSLTKAAEAQSPPAVITVKVLSRADCSPASTTAFRKGSGIIFKEGNTVKIISSEHVPFHANRGYCHFILAPELSKTPLRVNLRRVDWGKGLALFELPPAEIPKETTKEVGPGKKVGKAEAGHTLLDVPGVQSLENLFALASVESGDELSLEGFPFDSDRRLLSGPGKVIVGHSRRHLIPLLEETFEIEGAHGEFGMSGGAVKSPDGKVTGLISHQYLKVVPGKRSQIESFDARTEGSRNIILAIPSRDILEFIHETNPPAFVQEPSAMRDNRLVVITGGLKFELKEAAQLRAESESFPALELARGRGGTDPVGIGGVDPVGIGGEETATEATGIRVLRADSNCSEFQTQWPYRDLEIYKDLTAKVNANAFVSISYLTLQDESVSNQVVPVKGLDFLFRKLYAANTKPIVTVINSESSNVSEAQLKALRIEALSQKIRTKPEADIDAKLILDQIERLSHRYFELGAKGMGTAEIEKVVNSRATWSELMNLDFDASTELLKLLREVQKEKLAASLKVSKF